MEFVAARHAAAIAAFAAMRSRQRTSRRMRSMPGGGGACASVKIVRMPYCARWPRAHPACPRPRARLAPRRDGMRRTARRCDRRCCSAQDRCARPRRCPARADRRSLCRQGKQARHSRGRYHPRRSPARRAARPRGRRSIGEILPVLRHQQALAMACICAQDEPPDGSAADLTTFARHEKFSAQTSHKPKCACSAPSAPINTPDAASGDSTRPFQP